jgi:hypothetical protein
LPWRAASRSRSSCKGSTMPANASRDCSARSPRVFGDDTLIAK